jgi:hypothetical protein
MKKFSSGLVLFSVVLCVLFLFCPTTGYADTMTVTLVGVGGQTSGPDYIFPYNFSFNGSVTTTPLMCISYENAIYFGESWTATLVPVTGSGNVQYVEAAYIFSLAAAPGASPTTIAEAQWANWQLFDPGDPNITANMPSQYQTDVTNLLATASEYATKNVLTANYPNIDIFIPIDGSQTEGGTPQTFVGDPVNPSAPEPSSYLLFGTGLLGLAALWYRKRCAA